MAFTEIVRPDGVFESTLNLRQIYTQKKLVLGI